VPGWKRDRVRDMAVPIKYHNRFAQLNAEADNLDLEALATGFKAAVEDVAKELSLRKGPVMVRRGKKLQLWPKAITRLIRKRNCIVKTLRRLATPLNLTPVVTTGKSIMDLKYDLAEMQERIKLAIKQEGRRRNVLDIREGCRMLASRHTKEFFSWAAALKEGAVLGRAKASPVVGDDGSLLLRPEDIMEAWKVHFSKLNAPAEVALDSEALLSTLTDDDDFISMDYVDKTAEKNANAPWANAPQFPELPNCDGPIRMEELQLALTQLQNGKAAGPDGIPSEIFKAARLDNQPANRTNGNQTEVRMNPLAEVLLKLAQRMFDDSNIPESWRTADVVPVPKKGDPTNRDDYRGIALIPIGVKLLCKILNNRLSYAIELRTPEQGGFINEQAGFRTGEEAVGQVINLADRGIS